MEDYVLWPYPQCLSETSYHCPMCFKLLETHVRRLGHIELSQKGPQWVGGGWGATKGAEAARRRLTVACSLPCERRWELLRARRRRIGITTSTICWRRMIHLPYTSDAHAPPAKRLGTWMVCNVGIGRLSWWHWWCQARSCCSSPTAVPRGNTPGTFGFLRWL